MLPKPRVLALIAPKASSVEVLAKYDSIYHLDTLTVQDRAEAIPALAKAAALNGPYVGFIVLMGTHAFGHFDAEFLSPLLPGLKIVVSASAGYNKFDVEWMTRNDIWFCNTRNAVSEPTADMALWLILGIVRDTTRAEKSLREGRWRADLVPSRDPAGMKLGILGLGAIGKLLAKKAAVFNISVQYHNRKPLPASEEALLGVTYCSTMDELLATSEIISIHCPENANTIDLISYDEFAKMKDGVFFVNTARGPIVNEEALIAALGNGKVERAGLDVFTKEPAVNEYFLKSDKVIIQPHLGGLTERSWRDAEAECFENLRSYLSSGRPIAPVNELR